MCQVLQLVSHKNNRPLVILEKLQNSFLHQVVTEVDVQGREWVVLQRRELEERWADPMLGSAKNAQRANFKKWEKETWPGLSVKNWGWWNMSSLLYLFLCRSPACLICELVSTYGRKGGVAGFLFHQLHILGYILTYVEIITLKEFSTILLSICISLIN